MTRANKAAIAVACVAALACSKSARDSAAPSAFRAIGTEPFWRLGIDSAGLRFATPDDIVGVRVPRAALRATGDTLRADGAG